MLGLPSVCVHVCVYACLIPKAALYLCFSRGKCSVALLNETESVLSYLDKEVPEFLLLQLQFYGANYKEIIKHGVKRFFFCNLYIICDAHRLFFQNDSKRYFFGCER